MPGDADIAAVASLLADRSRAAICQTLLDGRFRTAGELAHAASITPSTASEHLARLLAGGFVDVTRQGRHRYYRLAGPDIAAALESLGGLHRRDRRAVSVRARLVPPSASVARVTTTLPDSSESLSRKDLCAPVCSIPTSR